MNQTITNDEMDPIAGLLFLLSGVFYLGGEIGSALRFDWSVPAAVAALICWAAGAVIVWFKR